MNQPVLTVVAEIATKPGGEEELKRELLAPIAPTRKQEGFVPYDLHVSNEEAARCLFYENWTSPLTVFFANWNMTASPESSAFLNSIVEYCFFFAILATQ